MGRTFHACAVLVAVLTVGVVCASGRQIGTQINRAAVSPSDQNPHEHQTQALQVELTRTIRARKARVGDVVKARTVTPLILSGQVVPEGSKITGHVMEVTRGTGTKGGEGVALAIAFDQFELRKRQAVLAAFSVRSGAMPQATLPQGEPDQSREEMAFPESSPVGQTSSSTKPTHMTMGGFENSNKQASRQHQDSTPNALAGATIRADNRADLRGVPRGSLLGMPGVRFSLDEKSGAARFECEAQKLELKTGLQLMLGVDPVKTPSSATGTNAANSRKK
jgi:hypothetical protein